MTYLIYISFVMSSIFLLFSTKISAELNSQECESAFEQFHTSTLSCVLRFNLNQDEKDELVQTTHGILQDLSCTSSISFDKGEVFQKLLQVEILSIPQQPINCHVLTNRDPFDLGFTIAPEVRFSDGRASNAEINMANISGVPPIIARLLEKYVNESEAIEKPY